MTLEQLQLKRAGLVAQRDQLLANLNATMGAVAVVEEMIGELESARLAAALPAQTDEPVVTLTPAEKEAGEELGLVASVA